MIKTEFFQCIFINIISYSNKILKNHPTCFFQSLCDYLVNKLIALSLHPLLLLTAKFGDQLGDLDIKQAIRCFHVFFFFCSWKTSATVFWALSCLQPPSPPIPTFFLQYFGLFCNSYNVFSEEIYFHKDVVSMLTKVARC